MLLNLIRILREKRLYITILVLVFSFSVSLFIYSYRNNSKTKVLGTDQLQKYGYVREFPVTYKDEVITSGAFLNQAGEIVAAIRTSTSSSASNKFGRFTLSGEFIAEYPTIDTFSSFTVDTEGNIYTLYYPSSTRGIKKYTADSQFIMDLPTTNCKISVVNGTTYIFCGNTVTTGLNGNIYATGFSFGIPQYIHGWTPSGSVLADIWVDDGWGFTSPGAFVIDGGGSAYTTDDGMLRRYVAVNVVSDIAQICPSSSGIRNSYNKVYMTCNSSLDEISLGGSVLNHVTTLTTETDMVTDVMISKWENSALDQFLTEWDGFTKVLDGASYNFKLGYNNDIYFKLNGYSSSSVEAFVVRFSNTGTWLNQYKIPDTRYITNWMGDFVVDPSGNLYISRGSEILKYGLDSNLISSFTLTGVSPSDTISMQFDESGNLLFTNGSKIYKYSTSGTQIGVWGTTGTNDGELYQIRHIKRFNDNYYIVDSTRIQVFDLNFNFIRLVYKYTYTYTPGVSFPGQNSVSNSFYSNFGIDNSGNIFTIINSKITKFNRNGGFLTQWPIHNMVSGATYSLITNPTGEIYIAKYISGGYTSMGTGTLEVYSPTGTEADIYHFDITPDKFTADPNENISINASIADRNENINSSYTGDITFKVFKIQTDVIDGISINHEIPTTAYQILYMAPDYYTFTGEDSGQHLFENMLQISEPGTYEIMAVDRANEQIIGVSDYITISGSPVSTNILSITASNLTVYKNQPLSVTVDVKDALNNYQTNYEGTVKFLVTQWEKNADDEWVVMNSTATGYDVPDNFTFSLSDGGTHTFTDEVVFSVGGFYKVGVMDIASEEFCTIGSDLNPCDIYISLSELIHVTAGEVIVWPTNGTWPTDIPWPTNINTPIPSPWSTDCSDTVTTGIPQIECEALHTLFNATNGAEWYNNINWGTHTSVASWAGIVLEFGHVSEIYLNENNLTGIIPPEIGDLTNLLTLNLSNNNISGDIPHEIGSLFNLISLNLRENSLLSIPDSIYQLSQLQTLDLHDNQISSILAPQISNMLNLTALDIGFNNFSGSIPAELGTLSLQYIYFDSNNFIGEIPQELGNLNLEVLNLYHNQLTGNIPAELGNGSIGLLVLRDNNLEGSVPLEFNNLNALSYLDIQDNNLSGYISPSLISGTSINYLYIQNNCFVFSDIEDLTAIYSAEYEYSPMCNVDTNRNVGGLLGAQISIVPSVQENISGNDVYQWYKGGSIINGASSRILIIDTLTLDDYDDYTYTITNSVVPALTLQSNTITLNELLDTPTNTPTATVGVSNTPVNTPIITQVQVTATKTPTPTLRRTNTPTPVRITIFNFSVTPSITLTPTSEISCAEDYNQPKCSFQITDVTHTNINSTAIKICWNTNMPTKGSIRYGLSSSQMYTETTILENDYTETGHCSTISNLAENTKYIYRISTTTEIGQLSSHDGEFTTDISNSGIDKLPDTGEDIIIVKDCISIDKNTYTFNDSNEAILSYTSNANSECYVSYGNSANILNEKTLKTTGTKHTSNLNLLKLNNLNDLYFQISCLALNTPNSQTCNYNGVIPSQIYTQYTKADFDFVNYSANIVRDFFNNPEQASNAMSTSVIAGTATTVIISSIVYPQWLSYGFLWFIQRKKNRPWGVVYDSETLKPIPFVVIRIINGINKTQIKQTISDTNGKFGFVLDAGNYRLKVHQDNYLPYEKEFKVNKSEDLFIIDIPLIKTSEFSKLKRIQLNIRSIIGKVSLLVAIIGIIITILSIILNPSLINAFVLILYFLQIIIFYKFKPPTNWGFVQDSNTGERISGAFVRLFDKEEGRQLDVQLVDKKGRFGFVTKNSDYYLKVSADGYKFPSEKETNKIVLFNSEPFIKINKKNGIKGPILLDSLNI